MPGTYRRGYDVVFARTGGRKMTGPGAPLPTADLAHIMDHTRELWESCRGARILVTGGTGLVGSWMLESALHANQALGLDMEITSLVRDRARFDATFPHLAASASLTLCEGDVRTFDPPTLNFTHIVHTASAASRAEVTQNPEGVVELIERGTDHVLEIARAGVGVRFLQMSSGSVYGPQPSGLPAFTEACAATADRADPRQRFGAAKRRAEQAGEAVVSAGVGFVSARAFALVGPRLPLDADFALGNFLGDARAGRPITITSDGTVERSWIYMADLTAWCWTLLQRGTPGRAYNVGSEEAMSLWDAAQRVARLPDTPVRVERLREPSPGAEPSRYIPDIARARDELGLDAWIPFDDAIRRTWGWLRNLPI